MQTLYLKKVFSTLARRRTFLDQILTSMSELYNDVCTVQHLPRIGRSDHQCLLIVLKANEKTKPISNKIRQMKDVNLIRLGLQWHDSSCFSKFSYDFDQVILTNFSENVVGGEEGKKNFPG